MAITAAHTILYSSEPDALRSVLADVFGWDHVDAGGGWLIFALPPGEVAVHPAGAPSHELCLVCDDLEATMAELSAKGVIVDGDPHDEQWGRVVTLVLPGDVRVLLYEARHPMAAGKA